MLKKQFLCICCPTGCRLTAEREMETASWKISGNRCPRGAAYAQEELSDPRRVVTATVASDSPSMPRIPVRTSRGLPRRHIDALLNRLYCLQVKMPVHCGEILLENVENTGVDVIFTSDCEK